MADYYNDLINWVADTGVTRDEARHAVVRCSLAIAKGGAAGYAAMGAAAYFMAMNPATAAEYLVASTAIGGGYALAKSPSCAEVREAIQFWNKVEL
jgi:hypothetical protein